MLSESSFIESSIFVLESGFSIVESGFLKRESKHESGFFPSPDFLRVRVQVRVRVRSGFRSMPKPDSYSSKSLYVITALASIYDNSKQEECSPLCQQVLLVVKVFIECLLHCLLNIRDAFFMS